MTTNLMTFEKVPFMGQQIQVTKDEPHYVALRPLFDGIGLDWSGVRKQIVDDDVLMSTVENFPQLAKDGKMRDMMCLPLNMLQGLFFKINAHLYKKKNPALYFILCEYQRQCYDVLNQYFTKGIVVNLNRDLTEAKEIIEHLQHELDFYKERTNEYMPAVARFAPLKEIEPNQFPRRGSNVNKPVKKQRAKWYNKKLAKIVKTHTIDDKMIKTFTAVVNASVVKGFKLSKLEEEVKGLLEKGTLHVQITFNFSK